MPSTSVKTGSSARAAVLRKNSMLGVSSSRTGRYHAIAAPSGIATTSAVAKPTPARTRLARVCFHISPSRTISHQVCSTTCSGGMK